MWDSAILASEIDGVGKGRSAMLEIGVKMNVKINIRIRIS